MKRILILTALVLLPVLACSQTVVNSPQTIEWDGESSLHEIGIQSGIEDVIILGQTSDMEYLIDLQPLDYYGLFTILVRGVEEESGYFDYSDWIRSDTDEDVIMLDGEPQLFQIVSIKPAVKPAMIRIR